MPIEQTAQTRLEPNILQVESLGVGLYRTNDTLALNSNQFLVIGEGTVENNPSLVQHNVIIDNTGMAINASLTERDTAPNRGYALYIKGDVLVEGSIRGNQFTSNPSSNINGDRFWSAVSYNVNNNIYSTNQVNISTELQARSNTHKFNIVATPNRDIHRAHLSLQNTELAQFRMGILGNAAVSPVVFNTTSNVPIEFHVGRDRTYFSNVYTEAIYGNPGNTIDRNTPIYSNADMTPHMTIDALGSVGIRTAQSASFPFQKTFQQTSGGSNTYFQSNVASRMGLYVNAPMYATDVLVYDAMSGTACNIDSIYVRSMGQSFDPSQIRPGTFSHGEYIFTSNVRMTLETPGPVESAETALSVAGNVRLACNLTVEGRLYGNGGATLSNAELLGQTTAVSVDVSQTLTASNTLRFGSFLQTQGGDGLWSNVSFVLSGANSNSAVEEIGGNVFVRNRMAVGLNLSNAEEAGAVFHQQFHVEKTAANRYELELWDRTLQPWNRKVAVLGHASADAAKIYKDASFVIATGTPTEDYYNGVKIFQSLPELPQNIYFYPGQYEYGNVYRPLIREDNPPVLGVFYNHRVGVGTYAPAEALHVEGGVYTSGDYYIPHPYIAGQRAPLAKFYQNNSIGRIGIPSVFAGTEYINPAAPRVGINTTAQYDYGLVVSGGVKLVDSGLYTAGDALVGFWLQGGTVGVGANAKTVVYTTQNVGIGVSSTVYPLEIYSSTPSVPTYLNIQANQVEVEAAPNYSKGGVRMNALNQTWVMEAGVPYANRRYVKQSFAMYDTRSLGSNVLMAGQYFVGEGRHQVYLGDIYDAGDYGPSNNTYEDAVIIGGNTTVFGSLKITSNLDVDGVFNLRGTTVSITGGGTTATPVPLAANPNDVLITGSVVHLLPRATDPDSTFTSSTQVDLGRDAYVSVGYTQDTDATLAQKSDYSTYPILRVHQYINSLTIGRFSSTRPYALFDLETGRIGADASARMRYGLDYSEGTPALVFIDRSVPSQPKFFMKSQKQLNNTINTGFNLPYTDDPVANIHIYNGDTGENMLRVNYVSTIDSATYAPTFQMHRDNTSTGASYQWEMRGPRPDSLQPTEQKLSVGYKFDQIGQPTVNREVLTLLSGGKVGINQSSPYYALDLRCTESHHAIRLYSPTNSSTGMLLFQSGPSNTFGGDAVNDYRMYASNNGFYLDQQSSTAGLVRVMQIDSNANLGIRTAPNSNYAVNVGGYLNVSDGILINGFPFLYRQTTSNIITGGIRVDDIGNIFINPVSFNDLNEPGLVIGAGVATSNLLHIYSGCNANLTVYDSIYDEAQVHYRTRNATTGSNSTYRLFASNERFQIEYNPTHSATTKITGAHTDYTRLVSWDALRTGYTTLATSNTGRMTLGGDLVFDTACNAGAILFQSGSMVLGASNGDLGFLPVAGGRLGIGTEVAEAFVDVRQGTDGIPLVQWTQTGTAPVAVFRGTGDATVMTVAATGKVGIGTTEGMQSKLHVEDVVYSRGLLPLVGGGGGSGMTVGSNGLPWESGYFSSNLQLNDAVLASVAGSGTLRVESRTTGLTTPRVQFQEWMVGEANGGSVSLHVVAAEGSNLAFVNSNLVGNTETGRVIPLVYSPTTRRVGIRSDVPTAVFQVVAGADETVPAMEIVGNACNVFRAIGSNAVIGLEVSGTGTVGIGTDATSNAGLEIYIPDAQTATGLTVSQRGGGDVLRLETSVSNVMTVLNSGKVGFGTTTPTGTARVHIEGDLYATGTLTASNLNVINLNTTDVEITFSEQVSITNTGTDTALKVVQTGDAPMVELQYGAMEDPKITAVSITSNGWVGIGTVAPAATLHVADSILYKTDYASTGALPSATGFPGMVAAVSAGGGAYTPYFATGTGGWSALAFYQDVLDSAASTLAAALASNAVSIAASIAASNIENKGLKYTVDAVQYDPASNILVSGDGIFGTNSNMPQLNLYRGFTYRFSNVSPDTVSLTSNTGVDYIGIDVGMVHDNATSNASLLDKYKIRTNDQVRWTVPMDAMVGSNYRYELEMDSNVYGILNIV